MLFLISCDFTLILLRSFKSFKVILSDFKYNTLHV